MDSAEPPSFAILIQRNIHHVQALEATSAACLAEAMIENGATSFVDTRAKHNGRIYMADGHPSNDASENILDSIREHSVDRLRKECEAHLDALVANEVLRVLKSATTFLVNLSMSFNTRGQWNQFLRGVELRIESRLEIFEGDAGEDAFLYRLLAVRYLCGVNTNTSARKKVILSMLPNGRWWNRDCVEVWVLVGQANTVDKKDVARKFAEGLRIALEGKRIRFFDRGRMMGKEAASSDVTLLDVCHGILRPSYISYCEGCDKKATSARRAATGSAGGREEAEGADMDADAAVDAPSLCASYNLLWATQVRVVNM